MHPSNFDFGFVPKKVRGGIDNRKPKLLPVIDQTGLGRLITRLQLYYAEDLLLRQGRACPQSEFGRSSPKQYEHGS